VEVKTLLKSYASRLALSIFLFLPSGHAQTAKKAATPRPDKPAAKQEAVTPPAAPPTNKPVAKGGVAAAKTPPLPGASKSPGPTATNPPCNATDDLIRLRALKDTDADGLAQALNSAFRQYTVFAVAKTPDSNSVKSDSPSTDQSKPSSPPSRQWLCIVAGIDPSTDSPVNSSVGINLMHLLGLLDRTEFVGVGLDERFVVQFANVQESSILAAALPAPAPGIELSYDTKIKNVLVLRPSGIDAQIAAKTGGDIGTQAAKVKQDLHSLDTQLGYANTTNSGVVDAWNLATADNAPSSETKNDALVQLEMWDAVHTAEFAALDPRDVAVRLGPILFQDWSIAVLSQQRAIVFRPKVVAANAQTPRKAAALLVATDALDRNVIYERHKIEQDWEEKLQTDAASASKQGSGTSNSTQPPQTTTISTTAITTPISKSPSNSSNLPAATAAGGEGTAGGSGAKGGAIDGSSAAKKDAAGKSATKSQSSSPIKITTTTSTQTTTPGSTQGNSGSAPGSGQSNANPSNTSNTAAGGSASNGGSSPGAGSTAAPGSTGGTPGSSAQTQTPQKPPVAGKVVRLFHLREASNIATVINAILPGASSAPLVQPLSDFSNDDLLLILPPAQGQPDRTDSIRRMISALDEPRPAVSLQVWSYEISSEEGKNSYDRSGMISQAQFVSDAYGKFSNAVQDADNVVQAALASGMYAAIRKVQNNETAHPSCICSPTTDEMQAGTNPRSKELSGHGQFLALQTRIPASLDRDFFEYLTERFQDCVKKDRYCLGYENALSFGPEESIHVGPSTAVISMDRFVVLLASAEDGIAKSMVDDAVINMQEEAAQMETDNKTLRCRELNESRSTNPRNQERSQVLKNCPYTFESLDFVNFHAALELLAQRPNLHMFRAALLDFLFQYKWSQAYPNDFDPYYLQRSAQNLDGYLDGLVTALNKDLDIYLHKKLQDDAQAITNSAHHVGLANYGEVQVSAISGDPANVSGAVNNNFDITQPALLKDVVSGLLGGGGSSGGSGQANSSGSTPTSASTSGASSTTSGNSNSGASTLAAAAKLLTPWQAVALNALAAASAPPQLVAQVDSQTTLAITPISLDTASAAELHLSLQISNPTTTVDASKNSSSSFIRQDLANSVSNYNVQTAVRVDSLKLFQVSSLSMDLTHPQSSVPVPVVGWAWEAVFGAVPGMKDVLTIPRSPLTVQNRSIAVVRAVVVPTAFDLGLSLPFRSDHIEDPISLTSKLLFSTDQTDNKLAEYHKNFITCILKGPLDPNSTCMTETRLSQLKEIVN
jgi:hypothetical protein